MSNFLKKTFWVFVAVAAVVSYSNANRYAEVHPMNEKYSKFQEQYKGYEQYKYSEHKKLNSTILELADKLLLSSRIDTRDMGELAITSFVDLHKLNKTTHFGRTLSESMFDELFIRGFNVTEFRGQNTLSVNADGEYFITRDVNLLNSSVPNKYILVGTYTMFEDSMLINARIVDNSNGKIVASARSYYSSDDCRILENCKKPRKIKIITDGCSTVGCPKRGCPGGICPNDVSGINTQNYQNERSTIKITSTDSKVDHTNPFITKKAPQKDLRVSLIK